MSETPHEIKRVMAIFAHPDDPEFFCGGLLAKWGAEGKQLFYVLATSGDKGTDDPTISSAELVAIREEEQRAAAACAGESTVIFLRHPDGEIEHTLSLRRDLVRVIRQYQPDVVITNDPQSYYFKSGGVNHPDHIAIGAAVLAAVYPSARDPHYFPELLQEGLQPHKVRHVFLSGTRDPNFKVNISAVLDQKIGAILSHRSQIKDPEGLIKRQRANIDPDYGEEAQVYTESYHLLTLRV